MKPGNLHAMQGANSGEANRKMRMNPDYKAPPSAELFL